MGSFNLGEKYLTQIRKKKKKNNRKNGWHYVSAATPKGRHTLRSVQKCENTMKWPEWLNYINECQIIKCIESIKSFQKVSRACISIKMYQQITTVWKVSRGMPMYKMNQEYGYQYVWRYNNRFREYEMYQEEYQWMLKVSRGHVMLC